MLPTEVQPVTPANPSQTNSPANPSQKNRVALAVGLTIGLLALAVGTLAGVYHQYRRNKRVLGPPPISSYALPAVGQTDLQSGLPQEGKRPPQLAPPPGAPMDTGNPPIYSHEIELGPPPSYESPPHSQGVGVAQ